MKLGRRILMLAMIFALLLSDGSVLAAANTLTMPAALQIIDEEAFYGDTSIGKVVLSNKVTEIRARAFANSTLSEINLPDSLTFIDGSAFDGPDKVTVTATEGTYAYNWAVEHGYIEIEVPSFSIDSIACSKTGTILTGEQIYWSVQTSNSVGDVVYSYKVKKNGVQVEEQSSSLKGYYSFIPQEPGEYALTVACQDEGGNSISRESRAISVDNAALCISSLSIDKQDIFLGDSIKITAIANGGLGDLSYAFDIRLNGTSIKRETTNDNEYEYTVNNPGRYQFFVTVSDEQDSAVTESTTSYDVYSEAELSPIAPELVFGVNEVPFSTTESEAPVYYPDRIVLSWNAVEYADNYAITIDQKTGPSWTNCLTDTTENCDYSLAQDVFGAIEVETLFRIGLSSVGVVNGDVRYYYFKISPQVLNSAILVEGKTSLTWNQASKSSNSRTFEIVSELPWTAETDAEWVKLYSDDDRLTIFIEENSLVWYNRTATVNVSNGSTTATITIAQGTQDAAVDIVYPTLSTNAQYPTEISTGKQYVITSGNSVVLIYELKDGNYVKEYESQFGDEFYLGTDSSVFRFEDGKQYKIATLNVYDGNYTENEVYDDILVQEYYVVAQDSASYVLVNGATNTEIATYDLSVKLYISSSGLVDFSTDVDWLTMPSENLINNQNKSVIIRGTERNMTETDRTGHVYVTCGTATAEITIIQKGAKPRLLFPQGVSQDEANPTLFPFGGICFTYLSEDIEICEKVSNEYADVVYSSATIATGEYSEHFSSEDFTAGGIYRIELTDGDATEYYYFKVDSSSLKNDVALNGAYDPLIFEIGSDAFSQSVTIKGANRWTASSSATWLTCSVTSGNTTSKTATITATANTTGEVRTATITFRGGSSSKKYDVNYIRVTQAASGDITSQDYISVLYEEEWSGEVCLLTPENMVNLDGGGTSKDIIMLSNGTVTISSDSDWLTTSKSTIASGKKLTVELDQNDTGALRFGTLTLSSGTATKSITVSQAPKLAMPVLVAPLLSTDRKNPTILDYSNGELSLNWNDVDAAVEYEIVLYPYGNSDMKHATAIKAEEGISQYSFILPSNWMDLNAGETYCVKVNAIDQYSYWSTTIGYFKLSAGDGLFIDNQPSPVWDNVTDYAITSKAYTVIATGNWTAHAEKTWMTLSRTSGASGDSFTVSLARNEGAARTGRIAVTCGSATRYLTVNQCAVIPEFPSIVYPGLSDDQDNPTMLSADTTELTLEWNVEPQAEDYEIWLNEFSHGTRYTTLQEIRGSKLKSNGQYTGSYTLGNLELTTGQLYEILFFRTNNGHHCAHGYYFMLDDGVSYVTFNDGKTEDNDVLEGSGEGYHLKVTSSGYWSATSSANWLTVGKRYIDEDYLEREEETAEENMVYRGNPGDSLCYYALPNTTGSSRTATITIKSGTATAVLTVKQEKQYTTAVLNSPTLGERPSESVDVPFGSLTLRWSACVGGTGKYEVLVYESDSMYGSKTRVYKKSGITARQLTIPESTFSGGKFYRIWLGSEIETGDDYENGHNYYFYTGDEDSLTLNPTIDWQYAAIGGLVRINASASGGAGSYKYAYELLRNGRQMSITTWMRDTYYTFNIDESGEYQVRVYVQDGNGTQKSTLSGTRAIEDNTEPETPLDPIQPTDERYSLMGYVVTHAGVGIDGVIVYIMDSQNGNRLLGSAVTDASGTWYVDDLPACSSAYINFYSSNYAIENNGCRVSITSSRVLSPFYATLASTIYEESSIAFSAPANGSTVPYNEPLNLSWNAVAGVSKYLYSARWTDQDEAFIYQAETTAESAQIAVSQMRSGKTLQLWVAAFDSEDNKLCQQTIRVNTTTTSGGTPAHSPEPEGVTGYFTMKRNGNEVTEVETSEDVEFVVDVPGYSSVQIVVDGKGYESYKVTDDRAVFTRSFSNAGTRTIQFRPHNLNGYGNLTEAKTLTVTSIGKLTAPVIHQIDTQLVGQDVDDEDLSWDAVPNATSYTVYLYHNDVQLWPGESNPWESRTENQSITIPGQRLPEEGIYTVKVVATGVNYDSSIATANFTVRPTNQAVEITYPNNTSVYNIGDTMHTRVACLQRNMNTRLHVVDPDGYSKDYDPGSDGVFYPVTDKPGTYKLTAFGSTKSAFTYEGREATSATVTVTINAPTVKSVGDPWGNAFAVVYSDESKTISSEVNCLGKVEVFVDDVNMGQQNHIDVSDYKYEYSVGNLAEGRHSVGFRVTYGDFASDIKTIPVFSVTKLSTTNQITKYASQSLILEDSPYSNTGHTIPYGGKVILRGKYGSDYSYVSYVIGNVTYWGFVNTNKLVSNIVVDQSSMTITSNSEENVYYIGESINMSFTVRDDVSTAVAHISLLKTDGNQTEYEVKGSKSGSTITISIPISNEGIYSISVFARSITGNTTQFSGYGGRYIGIRKVTSTVYRNNLANSRIIYESPIDRIPMAINVGYDFPLYIKGAWGNDTFFIEYHGTVDTDGIIYGFVKKNDVMGIRVQKRKKGYIVIAEGMEERIYAPVFDSTKMNSLFSYCGIDTITTRHASNKDMDAILNRIVQDSQEGDITYLYIYAHGVVGEETIQLDGKYKGEMYEDSTILQKLNKAKGRIVLIVSSCFSGRFVRLANDMGLSKEKFSILVAQIEEKSSMSWVENHPVELEDGLMLAIMPGSFFGGLLWEVCRKDKTADTNNDGLMTLQEIKSAMPSSIPFMDGMYSYPQIPQYYGNNNSIVFYID